MGIGLDKKPFLGKQKFILFPGSRWGGLELENGHLWVLLCVGSLLCVGGFGWKNEWVLSQEAGNPPCRTLYASE